VSGRLHAPAALPPGKRAPASNWIEGWVDPRAGLDDVEKRNFLTLPGLEMPPLGRPSPSQSLYGIRYPGSFHSNCYKYELLANPSRVFSDSKCKQNKMVCY
jgi:hypothetical protein